MQDKIFFKATEAANQKLHALLTDLYLDRDETFGNARLARNIFEKTIERQANRLAVIATLTDDVLTTIAPEDIPPIETVVPRQDLPPQVDREAAIAATPDPQPAGLTPQVTASQLAMLMNQTLEPNGISAKASLKDGCLQVMFESDTAPEVQQMVAFTGGILKKLKPGTIARVRLYGRQRGDEFPAWNREFELLVPDRA